MKTLVTAMVLATLVASPSFAQSFDPDVGSGNIAPAPYGETLTGASNYQNGADAFAQAPRGAAMTSKTNTVVDEGGNVQADPDLNIRSQLQREGEGW